MSYTDITTHNVLPTSVIRTIREAFDDAVQEFERRRGTGVTPDTRAKLARRLVDLAKHGECDFQRLKTAALSTLPL
jgi:hypothetical protein